MLGAANRGNQTSTGLIDQLLDEPAAAECHG
jgi:hypothetical protein